MNTLRTRPEEIVVHLTVLLLLLVILGAVIVLPKEE